jgi:hypothetical protein
MGYFALSALRDFFREIQQHPPDASVQGSCPLALARLILVAGPVPEYPVHTCITDRCAEPLSRRFGPSWQVVDQPQALG